MNVPPVDSVHEKCEACNEPAACDQKSRLMAVQAHGTSMPSLINSLSTGLALLTLLLRELKRQVGDVQSLRR